MKDLDQTLQTLPPFDPPPDGWSRLLRQLDARERRQRQQRRWAGGLALAASVLFAVLLLRPSAPAPEAGAPPDAVAGLMQQSQALEQRLSALKAEAGVWDGALAGSAAELQRDVALIDVQLSDVAFSPQADRRVAETLWQRRVSLLGELVAAHESPTLVRTNPVSAAAIEAGAEVLEL